MTYECLHTYTYMCMNIITLILQKALGYIQLPSFENADIPIQQNSNNLRPAPGRKKHHIQYKNQISRMKFLCR